MEEIYRRIAKITIPKKITDRNSNRMFCLILDRRINYWLLAIDNLLEYKF